MANKQPMDIEDPIKTLLAKVDMDAFIDQVEDHVGMGHGGWDMVDPAEIVEGVLRALHSLQNK